jgi:3-methylcrotonyl-CoA carboxylase alpha subunit
MEKAGVPVVPGYHGEAQETVVLAAKANEIGYPVLIKASAGGGGKGMRRVGQPDDFREALASAKREASSAFGDDRVLVEKYIERPRHIEVQVFGDSHGNVVHLFERDCSAQRRHQKVIEEAPAPGMSAEMRETMTQAAVKAAQAIRYRGAGTIEFIVDGSQGLRPDGFWFMEMNTRLQVEHPVTESVTGLDLVEWQLRVAAGEPLPLKQDEITLNGHAFEARLYAEDVPAGFLPATGTLRHLRFPDTARVDSGVRQGDEISPFYDPMIAKVITHGADREDALAKLADALGAIEIAGSVTNLSFLAALAANQAFATGHVDTGLIDRHLPVLAAMPEPSGAVWALAALAALGLIEKRKGSDPFDALGNWALWQAFSNAVELEHKGERHWLRVTPANDGWSVETPAGAVELAISAHGDQRYDLHSGEGLETVSLARWHEHTRGDHLAIFADGSAHEFHAVDALEAAEESEHGGDRLTAPMPGLVRLVNAEAGMKVTRGAPIIVLEAMKMEHALGAPRDGVIAEIAVSQGDQVSEGDLLAMLEAPSE